MHTGVRVMGLSDLVAKCLLPLDLPGEELANLAEVLVAAVDERVDKLNASIETAQRQLEVYENKYRMDYARFRTSFLANPGDFSQEDYVTWGFWERVKNNRINLLVKYEKLRQGVENC